MQDTEIGSAAKARNSSRAYMRGANLEQWPAYQDEIRFDRILMNNQYIKLWLKKEILSTSVLLT